MIRTVPWGVSSTIRRPVADCDGVSCVVLFGDAGMGKSTEL